MGRWGLLTNHALVLIHVANTPRSTLREISYAVGITERATLSILRCLEEDAIITRKKEGRRNRYFVDYQALLEHEPHKPYSIGMLAQTLQEIGERVRDARAASSQTAGPG